ncbi:putative Zn finger protein [Bacillus tianshenii]|jgi:uncharacterized Zn finger protein|uniref:Zn finger protein n=1 Tax=Sutcliffiella tianshenii TaxID=1463404 RepID=A0ABS2P497_9BACI|nr:hypothetical protein [Bacillus tianshenii]MBM7621787.1 putative Zn finger protein [Bacillus tianshenii]MCA1319044.1 hypothetical protein [Bacillus tianshenii]
MMPMVHCPKCNKEEALDKVLTAQSNQNVIFKCPHCTYTKRQIHTSKG